MSGRFMDFNSLIEPVQTASFTTTKAVTDGGIRTLAGRIKKKKPAEWCWHANTTARNFCNFLDEKHHLATDTLVLGSTLITSADTIIWEWRREQRQALNEGKEAKNCDKTRTKAKLIQIRYFFAASKILISI